MTDLPSFTAAWNVYDIPGTVIAGELTRQALTKARVVFTSNLVQTSLLRFGGDSHRPPHTVYGSIDEEGALVDKDGSPLKLLANDPGLSVTGIQWAASVLLPVPGPLQELLIGPFDAPLDGATLQLSTVIQTVSLPPLEDTEYIIDGTPL